MRRWIAGLDTRAALPIAVVCGILVLLLGAAIATVVVARAQEPTNGGAGMIPAAAAVCFVAIVVVLWYLARGHIWARITTSVLSLVTLVASVLAQAIPMGGEATIIRLGGWVVIFAALGFAFLWVPLPEREH